MENTIGIFCPNWKRPRVLHLWLEHINRIRHELPYNLPACVISEEEDKNLCGRYGVDHITQENQPVSNKFNRGVEWARDMGLDYALVSGSDDLFSTDTIKRYFEEADKGYDLIALKSIYFYSAQGLYRGQLVRFDAKTYLGVGKCISRRVLESVEWRPWNRNRNWGLDAIAWLNIRPHVKTISVIEDAMVTDIKSRTNINKDSLWMKKIQLRRDPQEFYKTLSDKEKEILFSL